MLLKIGKFICFDISHLSFFETKFYYDDIVLSIENLDDESLLKALLSFFDLLSVDMIFEPLRILY